MKDHKYPECAVCGEEIDDGYGECEQCNRVVCSLHNDVVKERGEVYCPGCLLATSAYWS